MKTLVVAGILYWLLFKLSVLVAVLVAFGLGLVVGGLCAVVGIETMKKLEKEELLQR